MHSNFCGRREFIRLCASCLACVALPSLTGCLSEETVKDLVVACGNDLGGLAIQAAVEKGMAEDINFGSGDTFIGDCCGSTAQFTLSTGDVDVAVLCPDAVASLKESNEDFIELGTIVLDGNLLVSPSGNFDACTNVGYMADRDEQLDDLKSFLGDREVEFHPLYTFATASALANGLVEAATMDLAAAAKTGFPAVAYTSNRPTSVMVARGSLNGDPRLEKLLNACNSYLSELQSEGDELADKLSELFEIDDKDEVMNWWQQSTTQFQSELAMTK